MKPDNFFSELKRRNVYKVAVAYAVVAWLLVQAASILLPTFEAPAWVMKVVVMLVALGFPVAVIVAWAFEMTPEGIKRTEDVPPGEKIPQWSRRKFAIFIASIAVVAAVLLGMQLFHNRTTIERGGATTPEKSIAVLPFENLSDNKENAFFADGVQDEILTDLAKIADLKVISRTSVMQYRSASARNLREIGQQLGVAHVLEGSVQRAANTVRINAQLIDARNDAHLWAQTYDRDLADVFAIQSEIAATIAGQLQARLSPMETAAMAQAPTTDLVANDLFVRARALDDQVNNSGAKQFLLQGISLLEEAVRRDPKFVLAYCLMCETHIDLYWYGFDHTPARLEQGRAALQEAERLQPDEGEVHLQKGVYAYHGFRDYATARSEFEAARKSLPNSARLFNILAAVNRRQGRWDDALKCYDRAIELDPRNFVFQQEAAFTYFAVGQTEKSEKLLKRAVELSPKDYFSRVVAAEQPYFIRADLRPLREQLNKFRDEGPEATKNTAETFVACALVERDRGAAEQALTYIPEEGVVNDVENFLIPRGWFVGLVARTFGDNNRAQIAFEGARALEARIVEKQPDYAPAWGMLGLLDAGLGHKAEAMDEGKRACELLPLSKDTWEGPVYVVNLANIYSWLGERDLALEQLAISINNPGGISYGELKLQPYWDSLRGDPRFEKIIAALTPKNSAITGK